MDYFSVLSNMPTLPLGLGAFVNPADVSHANETNAKQVYDRTCPLLVKLYARTQAGVPVGESTGYLYSTSADVIVTTSYFVSSSSSASGSEPPVKLFYARYFDGAEERIELLTSAAKNVPDVAILRGSRRAPRSLVGAPCSNRDTVYALGFSPGGDTPCFSKAVVSCVKVGSTTITTDADLSGCSGGPVVDLQGQLLGTVMGGRAILSKELGLTPSVDIHTFLLQSGQPGLAH